MLKFKFKFDTPPLLTFSHQVHIRVQPIQNGPRAFSYSSQLKHQQKYKRKTKLERPEIEWPKCNLEFSAN